MLNARTLGLALVLASVAGSAAAQKNFGEGFSQDELLQLPRMCLAQNFMNKHLHKPVVPEAERQMWANQLGDGYRHIHHYCWSLMLMRRSAQSPDERTRNANYRAAVANFDYVIRNWDDSFPLKPDALLRRGMVQRLMGNDGEAAKSFLGAIRAKPDYSPAYAALVDLHVDIGNVEDARYTIDLGLQNAPNSKILARKQQELDERFPPSK